MVHNPARGGPAKGAGNGAQRAPLFTAETAKAMSVKAHAARTQRREWRKAHPEWQAQPAGPSKKELRDYFNQLAPEVVDRVDAILTDDNHPKHAEVVLKLLEHVVGRPMQAIEMTGADGGALEHVLRIECNGLEISQRFGMLPAHNSNDSTSEPSDLRSLSPIDAPEKPSRA